jgi:tripartite-type tricarboxylate transporter receptor subunit TctC
MKRRTALSAAALAMIAAFPSLAPAQSSAPIKVIVGNAPGGISDILARLMAEQLAAPLGRTIIVENKPGAAGNIAADLVAKAVPDGNTLLFIYNSHPSIKSLYPQLPFDPMAGNTLAEAVGNAKRTGKPLTFASPGVGSPQHLMIERLKHQAGVPITVAHYKGLAPGQADVLAGHVDFTISSVAIGLPQVLAGKAKALAVSSAERLPRLPNVPTVKESGYEGFVTEGWLALLLPAKTPPAIAARYNDELNKVLSKPEIKAKLDQMGATPTPGAAEVLDRILRDESAMWTKVVKDLGIKPE